MTTSVAPARLMMLGMGFVALLTGCPGAPVAVNASGEYDGGMIAWFSDSNCPMHMFLVQEPSLPFPLSNSVVGTITIDLMCISDAGQLGLTGLPELTIPVIGEWSTDSPGRIPLSVDTALLNLPFTVTFDCVGTGTDEDGDGRMDIFAGNYSLKATISAEITGGTVIPLEFGSTFEVHLVAQAA